MADLNIDVKNLNLKFLANLPVWARRLIAVFPSVVVIIAAIFIFVLPKSEEISELKQSIAQQETEIAKSQSMVARLEELKAENEKLKKRLRELEEQLPEESEISSLLKQVSDLGYEAGMEFITWKPSQKRNHPSGIVYEVPVSVALKGSYHMLGKFFSDLTRLERIVNISDIALGSPTAKDDEIILNISFNAVTFTAVKEGGILE